LSDERQEIVRTEAGRYVWWPSLSLVEYLAKGERQAERTLALYADTNTYGGAMRACARDIMRRHRSGT
jgi:hypothetical protein